MVDGVASCDARFGVLEVGRLSLRGGFWWGLVDGIDFRLLNFEGGSHASLRWLVVFESAFDWFNWWIGFWLISLSGGYLILGSGFMVLLMIL